MKETNDFLMPEYYIEFGCKMGECRSACCTGWPITVSQDNYFHLLGMDCPKHLRDRLDVGLRMADHPTPEHFAQFNPRYDGNCPMRMEDGRCSIHAELGEDELPDICRLYPRGIRVDGVYECSCANSCEAVGEIFLRMDEPMKFVRRRITVNVPDNAYDPSRKHTEEEQKERMHMISLLQNRSMSLGERLLCLRAYLGGSECVSVDLAAGDGTRGTAKLLPMLEVLSERHDSIRDFGECALQYFGEGSEEKYSGAVCEFESNFAKWESLFENLLVNHIFFSRFPVTERKLAADDVWKALVLIYALLRVVSVGCCADNMTEVMLIDAVSACFRMIDHTEFEPYAVLLMKKFGADDDASIADLLSI